MSSQQYFGPSTPLRKELHGKPPFMLVYRSEAVLPIELANHTYRVTAFQTTLNNQALREALDLFPLVRGDAYLHQKVAEARMTCFYNRWKPLGKGLVRVSLPPIGKDHTLYAKV